MKKNQLDCIAYVDDRLIEKAEKYVGAKKKNAWTKWGAIAACLCLVAVGAATIMPKFSRDAGTGGKQLISGGIDEGKLYSVAVLPADKNRDDVRDATCNEISEAEIQGEVGLRDYVPTKLPDGFHFGQASLYLTTMKDGTIYKRLLITYRTGEGAKAVPNEAGAEVIPNAHDLGDEFRINIFSFLPDTSAEIYSVEEVRSELQSGSFGNGYFYVQYGDYYVGIEPLSLSAEEILGLIDSIGK